jgi:hypothetical protein
MASSEFSAAALNGGLKWKANIWGDLNPEWVVEPDTNVITKIAHRELNIPDDAVCEIKFLGEGAFNKVYTIQCDGYIDHVIRVSLPVEPHFKTMSEAATITYVRHHTEIPAPKVSASDLSNKNELGFEWMIQDFVPGRMLADAWRDMSWLKKELVVRKVIGYLAQLFEKRFTRMGNLYATADIQKLATAELPDAKLLGAEYSTDTEAFCQSRIVSMPFFWGKHLSCYVPRGPFTNSRDWLTAQVQLHIFDFDNPPDPDSDDSDDSDSDSDDEIPDFATPEAIKRRANRLLALINKFFPEDEVEEFVLHHQDLNSGNILVNSNDEISGVIDWECVHTVPLYYACVMPKFLDACMDRSVCPDPSDPMRYGRDVADDGTVTINELYYEHLEEYENQILWGFFLEEMGRVCPEWVKVHQSSKVKVGLEDAVACLGMQMCWEDIDDWIDMVEETGDAPSMQTMRRERQHRLNNFCG